MVACLAGPAGTVASHLSAAALFGLGKPPSEVHVTVPPSCSGRVVGCIRHRSAVDRVDRCVVAGIPCTRPARTLVDCAAVVGYEALCDLVDDALCRRLTKVSAVYAAGARVGRGPGRKGVSQIHRALQVWAPGPEPGSPAEMRMIRRVQQLGFPLPERQVVVRDAGGRFVARLDAGWEDRRFGLEYLGERHHGPREWVDDDTRDDRIAACGWRVESVDRFDLRPGSTRLSEILGAVFRA